MKPRGTTRIFVQPVSVSGSNVPQYFYVHSILLCCAVETWFLHSVFKVTVKLQDVATDLLLVRQYVDFRIAIVSDLQTAYSITVDM